MDLTIQPHKLSGTVTVPPSKSLAHQAVICAALSDGFYTVDNIALSDDIIATIEAMKAFGAIIEQEGSARRSPARANTSQKQKLLRVQRPLST